MVVTALVRLWVVGFTVSDSSNSAALLKLGTYVAADGRARDPPRAGAGLGRDRPLLPHDARDGFHWWRTLVAPIVGGAAMIVACCLLIANRAALSGAGGVFFIKVIPWAVLATFLIGVGIGLYYRRADDGRHRSIGRLVLEVRPRAAARLAA